MLSNSISTKKDDPFHFHFFNKNITAVCASSLAKESRCDPLHTDSPRSHFKEFFYESVLKYKINFADWDIALVYDSFSLLTDCYDLLLDNQKVLFYRFKYESKYKELFHWGIILPRQLPQAKFQSTSHQCLLSQKCETQTLSLLLSLVVTVGLLFKLWICSHSKSFLGETLKF